MVGDMISLDNLPGVAQVAIQGAKYAAAEIDRRVKHEPPQQPFHYFDKGSMATIARYDAVALIGKLRVKGFLAWLLWLAVHLVYLTGFKNRVTALGHWTVSFIGTGRAERVATEQQIFARAAIGRLQGGVDELTKTGRPQASSEEAGATEERREELEELAEEESEAADESRRGQRSDDRASL